MTEAAYAQAVEHFRFASISNPADVQAKFKLAASLLESGKTDDAVALLRTAVREDPQRYATSLKLMLSSGRGRFWLRPSAAARALS